jgi:hypothetical protein
VGVDGWKNCHVAHCSQSTLQRPIKETAADPFATALPDLEAGRYIECGFAGCLASTTDS